MYLIRLDDAAENMDINNWTKIEKLLDRYSIKPLVGVIPHNEDKSLLKFPKVENFWKLVKKWENNDWTICMHGYNHVYITQDGGINPVNFRSEFAGLGLTEQVNKIKNANEIFKNNQINTSVFFAPSHTFDLNTLKAIKEQTRINIISDTIANDIYFENGFYFIPQQSGRARTLPFKITTFCYHPNQMKENDFENLEEFIKKNLKKIGKFNDIDLKNRKKSLYDKLLKIVYFNARKIVRRK